MRQRSLSTFSRRPNTQVAVSLGGGSILLVCGTDNIQENYTEPQDENLQARKTQGLVQIRIVNLDELVDIQETSCYIHEDGPSDDDTYESLCSFQPEDFSTDSDFEEIEFEKFDNDEIYPPFEAPSKPVPPPPRESSLTQTLGRRMKMFRKTWSITKGSLGRIRRRSSVSIEEDSNFDEKDAINDHHIRNSKKYFSFKKHFRKNPITLSRFYLDESSRGGNVSSQNNNNNNDNNSNHCSKEVIYLNTSISNGYGIHHPRSSYDTASLSLDDTSVSGDHYSPLTEEPLYQFYAAAINRVALQSDSDGYEEVEHTTFPAAMDLARSGHRTLWFQTPQVIQSGLLQKLTMEERKIQEAKFEIITSEASYLNSLRVLENEFLKDHELTKEILTISEKEKLFGGVPRVLALSEKFLAKLEAIWQKDTMLNGLPDVLLEHAGKCLDVYVPYCSNQVSIDSTLKELRSKKNSKFLDAISRIESHGACQSLTLHSFLMLPMQRVTRLPLLADAVLSKLSVEHEERSNWENVLSSLSNVVVECNEGARTAAQESEIEVLARKLEYSSKVKPVILKGRYLVKSGKLTQLTAKTDTEYKLTFKKKFHKTPIYLLLLTDYLLVTKPKSITQEETYTVIDVCKRSLIALETVSKESLFAGYNAMILTFLENHCGRQVEYILTCESHTERERWLEAVQVPKRNLVGETLYETWDCPQVVALYSYLPNQPDELSLLPGDVINVLRKMPDGWYHGEKLLDGEQGWFPGNYTKEVASEHVRARNLKQRHRFLALTGNILQRRVKRASPTQ